MKFKVWCKNKNDWEKSDVLLTQDGKLIDYNNRIQSQENHVICPFTGELDINGKEIYEGDIVKRDHAGVMLVVKWCQNKKGFNLSKTFTNADFVWFNQGYRVVGNIHENPSMLKEFWDKMKD